mgnify:CR=1 FL=1
MTHAVTIVNGTFRVPMIRGVPPIRDLAPAAHPGRSVAGMGPNFKVPIADAPAVADWCARYGVEPPPGLNDYVHALWDRELGALSRAFALDAPLIPVTGLATPLLPTQRAVVAAAAQAHIVIPGAPGPPTKRALIDADEPGLGKTISALAALRLTGLESRRAVVICPASLTQNWLAEITQHFTPGTFTPWLATGRTPTPIPDDTDLVVIGWSVIGDWAQTLIEWGPDGLVPDEGHYAKSGRQQTQQKSRVAKDALGKRVRDQHGNLVLETTHEVVSGSARATSALDLAASVTSGLIMVLTGTPVVNRPLELWPLLEMAGIGHYFGGKECYQMRYCDPKEKDVGIGRGVGGRGVAMDYTGASHLMELNTRLASSGHYVRRTKEVLVADGLMRPKLVDGADVYDRRARREPWIITATSAEMAGYREIEDENEDYFADYGRQVAGQLRVPVRDSRVRAKVAAHGYAQLVRIGKLRAEAALVKVPYVTAKVKSLVAAGERVVIAAHHREVVDAYAAAFGNLKLQGSMSPKAIEEVKRRFNEDPFENAPVLVLSIEAGKTGHTLCKQALSGVGPACATMIFAEQVWTPGDEAQAQDRIWRIGQDRQVTIINAILEGSFDATMYGSRAKKWRVVNAIVDAIPSEVSGSDERRGAGLIATTLFDGGLRRPVASTPHRVLY